MEQLLQYIGHYSIKQMQGPLNEFEHQLYENLCRTYTAYLISLRMSFEKQNEEDDEQPDP